MAIMNYLKADCLDFNQKIFKLRCRLKRFQLSAAYHQEKLKSLLLSTTPTIF